MVIIVYWGLYRGPTAISGVPSERILAFGGSYWGSAI